MKGEIHCFLPRSFAGGFFQTFFQSFPVPMDGDCAGYRTDCNGEKAGALTAGITSAISAMSIQLARAV